ncbi:MAG: chlorite dismutase [Pyrinomonas sp.]|uniref:chlorite dismutase family protein n=1 Tax=Pyrinomonas sp. TaxID=2080306 RepID=UPI0033328B6C
MSTEVATHEQAKLRLSERSSRAEDGQTPVRRQFVNFAFYHVRPEWRLLDERIKEEAKREFINTVDEFRRQLIIQTYSLIGLRTDADFMIWRIGYELDPFQEMSARINRTALGRHLEVAQSYLSMTKRSIYMDKENPEHVEDRLHIIPGKAKYLFVYPFVKTRAWYALPFDERQEMMDEHIRVGSRYPSVKLNTTYSFGLDDQEFVVAFETDEPADFLDLVQDLRETKASMYTLRDTPMYTCRLRALNEILDEIG